jgi:hypothetical protein
MILTLLGPLSFASLNGQGPLWSVFFILVAVYVGVSGWRDYLKHRHEMQVPLPHLIFFTVGCLVMIFIGAWGLFRLR